MRTTANLRKRPWLYAIVAALVTLGWSKALIAQVSEGGMPYTFSSPIADSIPTVRKDSVDVAALLSEDDLERKQGIQVPSRFGYPFEVSLGLDNAGRWTELPNGDRVWRLRIAAPGAYSINLLYDEFWLPEGAKFFIYNENRDMVLGAFTARNNKDHGKFSTGPVKGDTSILEYYEPASVQSRGIIRISRVVHAYRNFFGPSISDVLKKESRVQGFGDSDICEINVNCPQGAPWADEKRAAAMILLAGGTRLCSGSIVNNVRLDYTPYLLTAKHCVVDEDTWIIMFNYESPNCLNIDGPTNQTVSGTTLKASNSASDFALLELSTIPPESYDIFYGGWSNVDTAPQSSVCIHHPRGDIKKISFDNDPAISDTWPGTPANSHWEVYFDNGTVEHGSSGSPLIDPYGRVVGQLHGNLDPAFTGSNYCEVPHGWYGKFSMSWDYGSSASTRLKDWLDPDNTGALTLGGMDGGPPPADLTLQNLSIGHFKIYTATNSITAGPNFTVESTVDVTFRAGNIITLLPAFTASNSSAFHAYIDAGLGGSLMLASINQTKAALGKKSSDSSDPSIPIVYSLSQNFPNPFNPETTLRYALPKISDVSLVVYNLMGQEVMRWDEDAQPPGYYQKIWNGRNRSGSPVASGMYIYRLVAGNFVQTRKMMFLK